MIYFLYGADTYRSRRKLQEMIAEYRQKNAGAGLGVHRFDAEEDDLKELMAVVSAGSLFSAEKLIVLERPFTEPRQFDIVCEALVAAQGSHTATVIIWDGALDADAKKRLKETERYFDKKEQFAPLWGTALAQWIREEAAARGAAFSPAEITALAISCGGDLWLAAQDMEKAALGSGGRGASVLLSAFDLGDTFFSSPRAARHILLSLLRAGEEEMRLFAYLAGHARSLLILRSYKDRGAAVPASAMIHPTTIQKTARYVGTLSVAHLARTLLRFFEEDRRIKTGISTAQESLLRLMG